MTTQPKTPGTLTVTFTPANAKIKPVTVELTYAHESERGFRYEVPATCEALPAHHGKGPRQADVFVQALYVGKPFLGLKVKDYAQPASTKNGKVKTTHASEPTTHTDTGDMDALKAQMATLAQAVNALLKAGNAQSKPATKKS